MPLGAVADRIGARRALISFFAYRAVAFAAILLARDFVTALAAVAAAGLISRATGPVTQALVLEMTDTEQERVSALAATRALRNAGYALGRCPRPRRPRSAPRRRTGPCCAARCWRSR
ncbi:hypothetical protein ACFQ2B_32315 [Streptomyces stramineus]